MAVLVGGRSIDLIPKQLRAIEQWARDTTSVVEVRLFGSRARGDSTPASDVDLCITMRVARRGSTALGRYTALADEWQQRLAESLEVHHVSLEWYPPQDPVVRVKVDREAVLLWQRA
jgi:predicted nucleotidyltransferase